MPELPTPTALPLGLGHMLRRPPAVTEMMLEPGDALVLYTDGITEARDHEGRWFGEARLVDFLQRAVAAGQAEGREGVAAAEDLHSWFVKNVAEPRRVYVWGESLGGLITEMLAEKHRDWVSGAAPMCGVLAGANANRRPNQ